MTKSYRKHTKKSNSIKSFSSKQQIRQKRKIKSRIQFTSDQYKMYLMYLMKNKQKFQGKVVKQETYNQIMKFIGNNKNYRQIYSFHDRMKQKYGSYDNIVTKLKEDLKINEEDFQRKAEKMEKQKIQELDKMFLEFFTERNYQDQIKEFIRQKAEIQVYVSPQKLEIIQKEYIENSNNKCLKRTQSDQLLIVMPNITTNIYEYR